MLGCGLYMLIFIYLLGSLFISPMNYDIYLKKKTVKGLKRV